MTALLKAEGVRRVGMKATGVYHLETAGSFAPQALASWRRGQAQRPQRGRDGKR